MLTDKGYKRVLRELKDYGATPKSERLFSLSVNENDLQNLYAIIRNMDGDYEGGEYILHIKLPDEYPFKAPVISFKTPNGRFQVDVNICLNISHFHPESWTPLINVEKIIMSVISIFYDDKIDGIGSLSSSSDVKKRLAMDSIQYNKNMNAKVLDNEI
jgi:ubiquitin-conjugating enzyme E2 J1